VFSIFARNTEKVRASRALIEWIENKGAFMFFSVYGVKKKGI